MLSALAGASALDHPLLVARERPSRAGVLVVTSDNGLPFPRCKANLYDGGCRMPLAVRWSPLSVDGEPRGMEALLARRAAGVLRRHRGLGATWLRGLVFNQGGDP